MSIPSTDVQTYFRTSRTLCKVKVILNKEAAGKWKSSTLIGTEGDSHLSLLHFQALSIVVKAGLMLFNLLLII
jgi:hypothetical protein